MSETLTVLLDGVIAGYIERDGPGALLTFTYDEAWRDARDHYPLSLSMPLAARRHVGPRVHHYLRGLLSDDPSRLARIAASRGVSPTDPFALLAHIGEDCPGAVQLARPERVDALRGAGSGEITWLSDADVAEQLRELGDASATLGIAEDEGHFSLPGALAKIALRWDASRRRWGRPSGRAATTHILKPPRQQIPFHCENEHLCLELAREVGLDAARSAILRVDDEVALVVERYDREWRGGDVRRVHQEDMSQALGADPELKYVSQGAPTLQQLAELIRTWSTRGMDDVLTLYRAVALNWAIAGTDAHPRNYSALIRAGTRVELAPLYDIASAVFLTTRRQRAVDPAERRLAMAIGEQSIIGLVSRASWETEARRAGLRPTRVLDAIEETIARIPHAASAVADRGAAAGIDARFAKRFAKAMRSQAEARLAAVRRTA